MLDFTFEAISEAQKLLESQTNTTTRHTKSNDVAFYTSLISISITNLFTIMFLIFIATNQTLRTKNVKTISTLALSILLTNSIYIIIALQNIMDYPVWLCRAIAISYYFFNLLTFAWSLAIAVDICSMLHWSTTGVSGKHSAMSFAKLCAACLSGSALLTTAAVAVDFGAVGWPFAPKFGTVLCWINSSKGHILFYYFPVTATVLTNIGTLQYS